MLDTHPTNSYIGRIKKDNGDREMSAMIYITNPNTGEEIDSGKFGGNGPSPVINGERDKSKREWIEFFGSNKKITASSYGLEKICVKVWIPKEYRKPGFTNEHFVVL